MLKTSTFTSDDAARKTAFNEKRIGQFECSATRHGFTFEKAKRIGISAYLDKPMPPIVDLVGLAVDMEAPDSARPTTDFSALLPTPRSTASQGCPARRSWSDADQV